MAVDWNADGMSKWREEAVKKQQECFNLLSTPMWREFKLSYYGCLKRQIGFALFGVPEEEPCAKLNDDTGYKNKKLKEINKIVDIIKKCIKNNPNPNNICVSFLFLFGKIKDDCITIPVIRILKFDIDFKQNINFFIDSCGRVYKNWQYYLDNNLIPECILCYPRNGVYSAVNGVVEVEFGISPAGRTGAKILRGFEIAGTALGMGAAGIVAAGAFGPVALPLLAGAAAASMLTGGYAAGRNIQTLVDRNQHQQNIGLDSDVSRTCWLRIGGGVIGIVSRGTMVAAAETDTPLEIVGQVAAELVALSSRVINSLQLSNIIGKARNEEGITALNVFQFTSAVLFFTHTLISAIQTRSLFNSVGMNSSGGPSFDLNDLINKISEFVGPTKACNSVPLFISGCLPTLLGITERNQLSLLSVCNEVCRKLIEITKSLLGSHKSRCNHMLRFRELLGQLWESWKQEIAKVVDLICRAPGEKKWSELVIKSRRRIEPGHITAMANTLIAEKRSLVECGNTAMPSHQRQDISDNSAVVGTDDGPNNLVDGETQTYESYYDEIANIFAKFVDRQMCRNPEDLCRYMRHICKFVKVQFQKKKSHYEKSWEMVKLYRPNVNVEDFTKKYGISGNPNNHFLQEVFNEFYSEEQAIITSLQLAYEGNAGTSAQDKDDGQVCLDADGVRFYPFYSMRGLASNGLPSKQQYLEMAAKLTGRRAGTDSISMSDSGDTAVIQVNAEADVIAVRCWEEDGKVSGIAAVLHIPSE